MKRSSQKELLDDPNIPESAIRRNMEELNTINTWLGGHAVTIAGLKKLLLQRKQLSICEIGSGGGDNLAAIARWCSQNGISVSLTGIDINPFCTETARSNWKAIPHTQVNFISANYRDIHFDHKPDIIFSSLFCHHFTNDELVTQLQWMKLNSQSGFFINDLHRHPLAYYSIMALTRLFSKSYLVKNDAPLSVKRSFVKYDWILLLQQAGINSFSVHWKWAFRWLVVVGQYP